MSEESDGAINTKTIEDIEVEMLDTELNLHVTFLGQIQDLLDSVARLNASTGFLSTSTIVLNMGLIQRLSMFEDVEIDFEQIDLINRVFQQVDEQMRIERTEVIRKSRGSSIKQGDFLPKEKVCQ